MVRLLGKLNNMRANTFCSQLYDQNSFYGAFDRDLIKCKQELVIESPFITTRRVASLLPTLCKLRNRGVNITVNTRCPSEHEGIMRSQSEEGAAILQNIGIQVLFTGGHHRKLVVLDRRILWEGSLNVLSQRESCELMRRIDSAAVARQTLHFIGISKFLR